MEDFSFYLYRTVNTLNGKYYYGVHYQNPNYRYDYYLGSGSALKQAIKKYGRSVFVREILERFKTGEEAYKREAEIVTEELIRDPMCYNEKLGGKGGMRGRKMPEEEKERIRSKLKGRVLSPETIAKLVAQNKGRKRTPEQIKRNSESHKGKKPSEETREKLRKAHSHPRPEWVKERIRQGKLGRICIHKGQEGRRVRLSEFEDLKKEGWLRGLPRVSKRITTI